MGNSHKKTKRDEKNVNLKTVYLFFQNVFKWNLIASPNRSNFESAMNSIGPKIAASKRQIPRLQSYFFPDENAFIVIAPPRRATYFSHLGTLWFKVKSSFEINLRKSERDGREHVSVDWVESLCHVNRSEGEKTRLPWAHKSRRKVAFHFFILSPELKKEMFFSVKHSSWDDDNEWKVSMLTAGEIWVALCNFLRPDSDCIVKWLKALPLLNSTGEISLLILYPFSEESEKKSNKNSFGTSRPSPPAPGFLFSIKLEKYFIFFLLGPMATFI